MFSQEYKKGMEHVVLSREKKEEIVALMTAEPVRTASHTLRVLTVAAVLCSLLAITAAAYYMGVFEFLQGQNEYAMLGMNEVYEACARPVGASVTAENGDAFTVDRVADVYKRQEEGVLESMPLKTCVAAISAGIVDDQLLLDLCYEEDSAAQVDLNCVMTGEGELVEIQGTGEGRTFTIAEQQALVDLCAKGIREVQAIQKAVLGG